MFVKDKDCTIDTPVVMGFPETPIYGTGKRIRPLRPGKRETAYEKSTYLEELLPLEEYDLIIVLFSGGKDSLGALLRLLELGVPKEKIELWHHDIDGKHSTRRMDWPVTQSYVSAIAAAVGVRLRTSWRVNGFYGELYRVGASYPIQYEDEGIVKTCPLSKKQQRSDELRSLILNECDKEESSEELRQHGNRQRFPAKSSDLSRRWCSAYLKIDVASSVICNLEALKGLGCVEKFPAKSSPRQGRWCSASLKVGVHSGVTSDLKKTKRDCKILVVSGERRGESAGRARYNEMELHRTNATARAHRHVHQWRAVIDYSLRDIWEIIRRHNITAHPCYSVGWGRCSCMTCIFGLPKHWAGIRELFPDVYEAIRNDEITLGFTLNNTMDLDSYIGDARSCVVHTNPKAIEQTMSGHFSVDDVYAATGAWEYPAGAFVGGDGGPC